MLSQNKSELSPLTVMLFNRIKNHRKGDATMPGIIKLLISQGAHLSAKNADNQTPLELACALGHWECAEILRKPSGFTDLHWAVQKNDLKTLRSLLEDDASPFEVNVNNETPVELACKLGYSDCAQELIAYNSRNKYYSVNSLHYSEALLHAIKKCDYPIAEYLIENEAPFESWNSECGNIALHTAVIHNQPEIIKLLIAKGADANRKIKRGNKTQTLKDLAEELGYSKCAEALGEKEIDEKYLNIAGLMKHQKKLFNKLKQNAPVQELSRIISSLKKNETAILNKILKYLEKKQDVDEEGNIFFITVINTMLNFPESSLVWLDLNKIFDMKNQGCIEADYIQEILFYRQCINHFIGIVKQWLTEFRNEIQETRWQVRDYAPIATIKASLNNEVAWKEGKPKHLSVLSVHLGKLNNINLKEVDILNLFLFVHKQLFGIKEDATRHDDTKSFYERKRMAYEEEVNFSQIMQKQIDRDSEIQMPAYVPVFCRTEDVSLYYSGLLQEQPQYINYPDQLQYPLATLTNNTERKMETLYPQLPGCLPYVPEQNIVQTNFPIDTDTLIVNEDSKINVPIELFLPSNQESNVVETNIDDLLLLPPVPTHKIYTEKSNTTTLYRNSPPKYVENKSEEKVERVGLGAT